MSTILPILMPSTNNLLLLRDEVGHSRPCPYKLPDDGFRYGKSINRDCVNMKLITNDWLMPQFTSKQPARYITKLPEIQYRYGRKNKPSTPMSRVIEQSFAKDAESVLNGIYEKRHNTEPKRQLLIEIGFQYKEVDRARDSLEVEEVFGNKAQNQTTLIMIAIFSIKQHLNHLSHYCKTKVMEQPKMLRRTITPIYPPPGLNLQVPEWPVEQFMLKIGKGCSEHADKFESLKEVFGLTRLEMKAKGVPPRTRRYIFSIKEQLRRGVLTFEYLERRTVLNMEKKK